MLLYSLPFHTHLTLPLPSSYIKLLSSADKEMVERMIREQKKRTQPPRHGARQARLSPHVTMWILPRLVALAVEARRDDVYGDELSRFVFSCHGTALRCLDRTGARAQVS